MRCYKALCFLGAVNVGFAVPIFCPNGLKLLQPGMTIKQVESACGQPKQVIHHQAKTAEQGYDIWYYRRPMHDHYGAAINVSYAVVLKAGKVEAIRNLLIAGRKGLIKALPCQDQWVPVGASVNTVIKYCGPPERQQALGQDQTPQARASVVMLYQLESYLPTFAYVFNNDAGRYVLTGVEQRRQTL